MWIVVAGNIADGMSFHGPFATAEEANEWADIACRHEDWIVVNVKEPKPLKKIKG